MTNQTPVKRAKQMRSNRVTISRDQVIEWFDGVQLVREVLATEGCVVPADKKIPIIDESFADLSDCFGYVENITIAGDSITGVMTWKASPKVAQVETLFREGHIGEFNLLYERHAFRQVAANAKYKTLVGPFRLVTKWTPIALQLSAMGSQSFD